MVAVVVTLLSWDVFYDILWYLLKTYWRTLVFVILLPMIIKLILKFIFLGFIITPEGITHRGWYVPLRPPWVCTVPSRLQSSRVSPRLEHDVFSERCKMCDFWPQRTHPQRIVAECATKEQAVPTVLV